MISPVGTIIVSIGVLLILFVFIFGIKPSEILASAVEKAEEKKEDCLLYTSDIKGKTKEEIFANFHSNTRYNIRLATKKGVIIKHANKEDLKDFHKIMVETGKRDGFIIRPLEYFEKMYDELAPEHMELLMAYYEDKPIAGIIPIMYGNKTWYLYGASSNQYRNLMPNYLLPVSYTHLI